MVLGFRALEFQGFRVSGLMVLNPWEFQNRADPN